MIRRALIGSWFVIALPFVALWASTVCAQEPENPFADDAAEMEEDEVDAGVAPAGARAGRGAAAAADAEAPAEETDPIVLAIQDANPQTADQLARAIEILINAKRFDVAKRYLTQLIGAVADDEALLQLHEKYGPTWFLRVAQSEELAPEGVELAQRAWDVAQRAARDPVRIQALLDQLADPRTRREATAQLRKGGTVTAAHLTLALGDANRAAEQKTIQAVLLSLGVEAVQPMLAALDGAPPEVAVPVIQVLDAGDDRTALPKLVELAFSGQVPESVQAAAGRAIASSDGRLPGLQSVERFLTSKFLELFQNTGIERADAPPVMIWQWDEGAGQLVSSEVDREMADRLQARRIAESLVAVFPENREYQRWLMAAQLEWQQAQAGDAGLLAEPPGAELAPEEAELLSETLAFCLEMDRYAGAIGAAMALGAGGSESNLHVAGGELSPLAQALYSKDPRVQFAAAMAIMRINPSQPFAGSSRFRETLAFMLGSAREPKALVANPRLDEGQTWGGYLLSYGWEPEIVTTGSDALQRVANSPYYEFILVSDAIDDPALTELIQMLRQTSGGGEMPIAVICRAETYDSWKHSLDQKPLLVVMPAPQSDETAQIVVRRVLALPGRRMPPAEVRVHYAAAALDWIRMTVASPSDSVYHLLQIEDAVSRLLYDSPLEVKAAEVLGAFGTRTAQKQLVDVASQPAYSLPLRQAAAQAFAMALAKRGVMLTSGEILQQYERYNASATLDRETQTVLGSILDALESPRAAAQASSN